MDDDPSSGVSIEFIMSLPDRSDGRRLGKTGGSLLVNWWMRAKKVDVDRVLSMCECLDLKLVCRRLNKPPTSGSLEQDHKPPLERQVENLEELHQLAKTDKMRPLLSSARPHSPVVTHQEAVGVVITK